MTKFLKKIKYAKWDFFGNQGLKFMHFLPLNKAHSYISIWGEKDTTNAKLRFIFENGSEFVLNFELKATKLSHILINRTFLIRIFSNK